MKIYIESEGKKVINMTLPNALVNIGIRMAMKSIKISQKKLNDDGTYEILEGELFIDNIDKKALKEALDELKNYKGLRIIDVISSKGNNVRITI